jgi:hypothetical protein
MSWYAKERIILRAIVVHQYSCPIISSSMTDVHQQHQQRQQQQYAQNMNQYADSQGVMGARVHNQTDDIVHAMVKCFDPIPNHLDGTVEKYNKPLIYVFNRLNVRNNRYCMTAVSPTLAKHKRFLLLRSAIIPIDKDQLKLKHTTPVHPSLCWLPMLSQQIVNPYM